MNSRTHGLDVTVLQTGRPMTLGGALFAWARNVVSQCGGSLVA